MKLGFVSAILPEFSLEQVLGFAQEAGFASVELMCWPPGKAERRYAGVSHLDVTNLSPRAIKKTHDLLEKHQVEISGLGYYPNPLSPDRDEADTAAAHLRHVIDAAAALGVGRVNSFVGREYTKSVDDNWPRFLEVWRPLIAHADARNVKVGIENCPMSFGADEWPGGKNLATSPAIWRRMFHDIPSPNFGLNFDPSHFVLQHMDYVAPLAEFRDRIFHAHAKDVRIDRKGLDEHGVFAYPKLWHSPKLPGQGDVHWGAFLGALADAGYDGHLAIEVEDRAFEGSLEKRLDSLIVSRRFLGQFIIGHRPKAVSAYRNLGNDAGS
ncbi:MAG: sugar phosphate isomerase/epimerase [Paludisphaera borealis]|uniref:sugar phosphate isomerase/epimerase family protein n=1 Tax=Paludisphaera borealis TaxID=1387353 RepID=UPI0028443FD6|nr:sugar phosphate isomerase/epimerase family protein [Paludisphaera borealis]MDR3620010.1 sugar phosphate isomerase/epimerase [Paludisphaera borealis]